jgi:hypothetical protein
MTAKTLNLSLILHDVKTTFLINHQVFRALGRLATWHEY